MATLNYATDKQRFIEIQNQIKALNLEAEKIILAYQNEDKPEGRGACQYNLCPCESYKSGGAPAVCDRSHCGHYASDHAF